MFLLYKNSRITLVVLISMDISIDIASKFSKNIHWKLSLLTLRESANYITKASDS